MKKKAKPKQENEIVMFGHCRRCLEELPDDMSPREYASIEVGITKDGRVQVWCKRHEMHVGFIGSPGTIKDIPQCGDLMSEIE